MEYRIENIQVQYTAIATALTITVYLQLPRAFRLCSKKRRKICFDYGIMLQERKQPTQNSVYATRSEIIIVYILAG